MKEQVRKHEKSTALGLIAVVSLLGCFYFFFDTDLHRPDTKKARKIRFSWSLSKIQIFFVGGLFIFVAFPHFCRCFISTETLMAMFFDTTLLKICVLDISYLLSYCTLQLPPRPPLLRPSIHMAPSNFLRPSITINIDTQHSQKNAYVAIIEG